MSDDDLTPWNPAHFGHVDFQKESDGQLTIFFEDSHEPPDPDDFASLEAYKIAWIEWEQTQILPQQEEIMNFITTSFDAEIEQLKAKLAELETQKHRISACANRIVTQVGECVTEMRQVGVSDEILADWAGLIYKEITGQDVPALSDSDVLKSVTAWEEKYKQSLAITSKQIDQLTTERDELLLNKPQETDEPFRIDLLKKASDLTIERDTALQKYTDLTAASLRVSDELKGYKKTVLELTTANQKLTEEVLELRGESPHIILKEPATLTETQAEESEEDPRQDPEFLEATRNQEIIAEFLRKLDRTARVDKLIWRKIRELPLNSETMRELGLQVNPKSKIHKYLLEQMPVMCAKYIEETGDNSDLNWLPGHFVESVREIVAAAEEADPLSEIKPVFQRGDTVYLTADPSSQAKVLDINGEWLNVQDSDGLTDMWNISDISVAE